jgi:hypothetical protein
MNSNGQSSPPAGTFSQVDAGEYHSCGLRTDGTLACWGDNSIGQTNTPTGIFTQMAGGGNHSCSRRPNATWICWGSNYYGQTNPPGVTCADFDGSGTVDVGDLTDIADRWMRIYGDPSWNSRYDLFPTNRIDMIDLMEAMSQWGQACQ